MPHSARLSVKSCTGDEESAIKGDSSAEDNAVNAPNAPRASSKPAAVEGSGEGKKRKRKRGPKVNGVSASRRRLSVSKPARDPRDEAAISPLEPLTEARSPSPVIDFDGLSRPSMPTSYMIFGIEE